MDDELERKIAAMLDRPDDTSTLGGDDEVKRLLATDTQAQRYLQGLKGIEAALRAWPPPPSTRTDAEWEAFAAQIEHRLGEAPREETSADTAPKPIAWDPLDRPPLEGAVDNESEMNSMAESHDDNQDDDDLAGLAALTRTSLTPSASGVVPPPPTSIPAGPSIRDDAMDESSGVVDIQKLAAIALKQEAPPAGEALKATMADASASTDVALRADPVAAKGAASAVAALPAGTAVTKKAPANADVIEATRATPAKVTPIGAAPRSNPMLWIGPILAAAAAGGFFYLRSESRSSEPRHVASSQEETTGEATSSPSVAAAPEAPVAPAPAPVAAAAPTPAVEQPLPQGAAAPPPMPPTVVAAAEPANAPAAQAGARGNEGSRGDLSAGSGGLMRGGADGQSDHPARDHGAVALNTATDARERRARGRSEPSPPETDRAGGGEAPALAPAPSAPATVATATTAPAPRPAAAAAGAAPPAAATTAGGGTRSMDDLMAAAVGGPRGGAAGHGGAPGSANSAPAEEAPLPDRPTRQQVTSTMAPLSPAVRACTQGQTGTATVAMMIQHDGTVTSASVSGPFTGEANSCIQGVVRRAHFSPFARPSVPIVYPFSIQPPRPGAE